MVTYRIYSFLIACFSLFASHLAQVSNGGFELRNNSTTSPLLLNSLNRATGWYNSINSCDHHYQGANWTNYSNARTGIGHAWIIANSSQDNVYREIARTRTSNLIAGQVYKFEFYASRSDGNYPVKFGAYFSLAGTLPNYFYPNDPDGDGSINDIVSSQVIFPQITHIMPSSSSYVKIIGCFTPTVTGQYDILIGCFEHVNNAVSGSPSPQLNAFRVDDVSLIADNDIEIPIADVQMQSVYCVGDQIIADGTGSFNDVTHEWELFQLNGSQASIIKRVPNTLSPAGILNVSNLFSSVGLTPQAGSCYRLVLHTYNECVDSYSIDFCIDNPSSASIVFNGQPVCEGQSFDLEVTGENGWTYAWSTGQSGVGLKNITTIADPNVTQYSVTVTTPSGCQSTETVNIVVHANNNVPPSISGINGGNETIAYANAGGNLSFNIYTSDSPNEIVNLTYYLPLPNGAIITPSGGNQQSGQFQWNNIPTNAEGLYNFTVKAQDDNVCGFASSEKTFYIKIVCEDCPLDVYYENRTPNNSPLPSSTIAGHKIVAGENVDPNQTNGLVETGNDFVTFRAPIIDLMPGFTGGSNFDAIIDAGTCLQDCETFCCDQFTGFSYDTPIGNVFSPGNQDGVNDFWYLRDEDNPFCAFGGATKFRLEVYQGQTITYFKQEEPVGCCPFVSPAPSNPIAYRSIFWDGRNNTPLGGNNLVLSGDYQWIVKIWSPCGDEITLSGQVYVFGSNSGMILEDEDGYSENLARIYEDKEQDESDFNSELTVGLDAENTPLINIYPNPTTSILNVEVSEEFLGGELKIYDILGNQVWIETIKSNRFTINNFANLSEGVYTIFLSKDAYFETQKVVKQ